ncbi:MAG: hypothetical protein KGI37_08750 [Alphaproteobacteria bacterium]|nr:hypothetical protein [Alphaproteobacteria bacterium]
MNDLLSGFGGALLGAFAVVISGLLVENYKQHRDRCAAASAIAGEIFSIVEMITRRNHVAFFTWCASQLDDGHDVKITNTVGPGLASSLDPVIEAHLNRLGLLNGNERPERIVKFYTHLRGIRIDIVNMANGVFDTSPQGNANTIKSNIIKEDLAMWEETEKLAHELLKELKEIANDPWWLKTRWEHGVMRAKRLIYFNGK